MKLENLKEYRGEFFLVSTFIFSLPVLSVSNFSFTSLILKAVTLLMLYISLNIVCGREVISYFKSGIIKKQLLLSAIIILIPAVSLTWSANPTFGMTKLIHLLFPLTLALLFSILLLTMTPLRLKILIGLIILVPVIFVIASLIIKPFVYNTLYSFSIDRWSHIILGRFVGLSCVILLILFIYMNDKVKLTGLFFILIFLLFGTFYIGSRSSVLALLTFLVLMTLYIVFSKKVALTRKFSFLFFNAAAIVFFVLIIYNDNDSADRFNNLVSLNKNVSDLDGPAQSRITAWNAASDFFYQKPVAGMGFGGFRSDHPSGITGWIKYPHNIFLEIASELGMLGIILFISLLIGIIYFVVRLKPFMIWERKIDLRISILSYLVFVMVLAQFTKDISTQTLFWLLLSVITISEYQKR